MALRRARLLSQGPGSIYMNVPRLCSDLSCPLSWAVRAFELLRASGLSGQAEDLSSSPGLSRYSAELKASLVVRDAPWLTSEVAKSRASVPYSVFQQGVSQHVFRARAAGLP